MSEPRPGSRRWNDEYDRMCRLAQARSVPGWLPDPSIFPRIRLWGHRKRRGGRG